MLEYFHASNFEEACKALKADAKTEFTPDPKGKYTGLLEKKWTSVIRLQKKVTAVLICLG
jgi:platelet-activating factor acetylhydrolase IB subunit alpha